MRKSILYALSKPLVRVYAGLFLQMDIHRHDLRLPEGPKLFVANHPSASDPFLIHLLSRQQMGVFVTGNAFKVPLLGDYLRHIRQIAVLPGQGSEALEQARRLIESGHSVGIFPEGDFSPQAGGFREPRSGAARLALSTGVPVIPVGIYLSRERIVRLESTVTGRVTVGYWYFGGPYGMTVGKPMQFEGNIKDREQVNAVSSAMMHSIKSLAYESEQRLRGDLPPASAPAEAMS